MSRKSDLSKPLSEEDVAFLQTRLPQSKVDRLVALSHEGDPGLDLIGNPEEEEFDPDGHSVDEVVEYLEQLDPSGEEYARVLAVEENGKARKGILE